MFTINLQAPKPQSTETWVKCQLGCIINNTPDPLYYASELEKELNENGLKYGQVLNDSNKFLCIDPVNGAYVGNVSTDKAFMMKFLSKQHLDYFIDEHNAELPESVEYALTNPFHGLNETYEVVVELIDTTPIEVASFSTLTPLAVDSNGDALLFPTEPEVNEPE